MRFLADENFPVAAIEALIDAGYDVVWVGAVAPGVSDSDVLEWAAREGRILLTSIRTSASSPEAAGCPPRAGYCFFASRCPGRAMLGHGSPA